MAVIFRRNTSVQTRKQKEIGDNSDESQWAGTQAKETAKNTKIEDASTEITEKDDFNESSGSSVSEELLELHTNEICLSRYEFPHAISSLSANSEDYSSDESDHEEDKATKNNIQSSVYEKGYNNSVNELSDTNQQNELEIAENMADTETVPQSSSCWNPFCFTDMCLWFGKKSPVEETEDTPDEPQAKESFALSYLDLNESDADSINSDFFSKQRMMLESQLAKIEEANIETNFEKHLSYMPIQTMEHPVTGPNITSNERGGSIEARPIFDFNPPDKYPDYVLENFDCSHSTSSGSSASVTTFFCDSTIETEFTEIDTIVQKFGSGFDTTRPYRRQESDPDIHQIKSAFSKTRSVRKDVNDVYVSELIELKNEIIFMRAQLRSMQRRTEYKDDFEDEKPKSTKRRPSKALSALATKVQALKKRITALKAPTF